MIGVSLRRHVFGLGVHLRSKSLRFKLELAGLIVILPLAGLFILFWLSSPNYHLSDAARLLIGPGDTAMQKELSYHSKQAAFYLNQKGMSALSSTSSLSIGGNFSSTLPSKLSRGMTIYDDTSGLSFSIIPEINAANGKEVGGHIVYPSGSGIQAVYTVLSDGIKEDLILNHSIGNNASYSFDLKIPSNMVARQNGNGVGIYSANPVLFGNISYGSPQDEQRVMEARANGPKDHLAFELLPPIINQSNGHVGGIGADARAVLSLHGNRVTVAASNLSRLSYPISIDPSVVVTSSMFTAGNNEGDVSFSNGQLSEAGLTGGSVSSWNYTSAGANNGTTFSAGFNVPRSNFASVAYNGYLYVLGGQAASSSGGCTSGSGPYYCNDVQYAAINSNGTIGTWYYTYNGVSSSSYSGGFTLARTGLAAVTYNGYLYVIGGQAASSTGSCSATGSYCNDVQYALICNGNNAGQGGCSSTPGTVGIWNSTSTFLTARSSMGATVFNDYLYIVGGQTATSAGDCTSGTNPYYCNGVEFAVIHAGGTLGSWNYTANNTNNGSTYSGSGVFSTPRSGTNALTYNGYLYILGGQTGSSSGACTSGSGPYYCDDVQYAPLNSNGTVGTWNTTNAFVNGRALLGATVYDGYIYISGGQVYQSQSQSYSTPGSYTFSVPGGVSSVNVTLNGAQGGASGNAGSGGDGGEVSGTLTGLSSGVTSLTVVVGSSGNSASGATAGAASSYGGGGAGGNGYSYGGGGGGGESYIENGTTYLAIAPGGGGGGDTASGGTGGGTTGASGGGGAPGGGGTQTAGGTAGSGATAGASNSGGTGGSDTAKHGDDGGGGGGGGYWGGGGGGGGSGTGAGSGGGGSALVPSGGSTASGTNSGNGSVTITWTGPSYYSDTQYASINSDGTLEPWQSSNSINSPRSGLNVLAYNGYLYSLGGQNDSSGGDCTTVTSIFYYCNGIQYAQIDPAGIIGMWTASTSTSNGSLPVATDVATSVVYNGYVYEIGGHDGTGSKMAVVDYAALSSSGALSAPASCSGTVAGVWCESTSTSNGSLPVATGYATSVVYNGYVYEIGGGTSSGATAVVDYAALSSSGALSAPASCSGTVAGVWCESTSTSNGSLPVATENATSVVYNGYVYEIGGYTSSYTAVVDYAALSSSGTLSAPASCSGTVAGIWCESTSTANGSLPTAEDDATSVVYNGYVYEIGGDTVGVTAVVDYAPINNGGPGTTSSWTASTSTSNGSLPVATENATSVAYNGYVYEIGGSTSSGYTAVVDYAALSSSGALSAPASCSGTLVGVWCESTSTANGSLPVGTDYATSVVYNGYVYEIGGYTGSYTAVVDYASINSNGSLGAWSNAYSLPTALTSATSVVYNGYVYEIGGYTGSYTAVVDYAGLQSIPRVGYYSKLIDITGLPNNDPTPIELSLQGSAPGNPGIGSSGPGGVLVNYQFAANGCTTFNTPTTLDSGGGNQLGPTYGLTYTTNGCGVATNVGRYMLIRIILDDSQSASFPDSASSHSEVSNVTLYYHPATNFRLRIGATFSNGSLQSLDSPPTPAVP